MVGKWFPLQPASTDSTLLIDGSRNAARKIVQSEDCLRKLKDLACRGPIERDQIWPSQATIGDSSASPKLSTWAVAGLLKNLSLYTVPLQRNTMSLYSSRKRGLVGKCISYESTLF